MGQSQTTLGTLRSSAVFQLGHNEPITNEWHWNSHGQVKGRQEEEQAPRREAHDENLCCLPFPCLGIAVGIRIATTRLSTEHAL
uniref:Uncharacterized protein LOC117361562 isoform X2 n=1 Tax=Geotrypetes seraphini TaxID=260995 RepID=A0A6P8R4H3_GEOSA|nr:uncharacterized protein LOC117361562 isoform X2 [Geotrypetes seraphini]